MKVLFFTGVALFSVIPLGCNGGDSGSNGEGGNGGVKGKFDLDALNNTIAEFQQCKKDNPGDKKACRDYTARAIEAYYGIDDFADAETKSVYRDVYLIADDMQTSSFWKKLGQATDEGIWDKVRQHLAEGRIMLAYRAADQYRNIVMLMPGEGSTSMKWGKVKVPNAAVLFYHAPEKSFTDKTINYAWPMPAGVEIWIRIGEDETGGPRTW